MQCRLPRNVLFVATLATIALLIACKSNLATTEGPATEPVLEESTSLDRVEVTGTHLRRAEVKRRQSANAADKSLAYTSAPAAPPSPAQMSYAGVASYAYLAIATPQVQSQPANAEKYAERTDNPVHRTSDQPVSTFSVDVDTGSYSNVRRMLTQGIRPPADSVRA